MIGLLSDQPAGGLRRTQKIGMPRFFFHVRDGGELIPDPDGVDLPNLGSAADECRRIVREVMNEEPFRSELVADRKFEITDEQGRLALLIPFVAVALV